MEPVTTLKSRTGRGRQTEMRDSDQEFGDDEGRLGVRVTSQQLRSLFSKYDGDGNGDIQDVVLLCLPCL